MLKKEMPLVSIVIPVYNGSNYLAEAVESALNQTYENCEILVINDGSNDDGATEGIAKSYGNKIRYYEKENGGVASALNLGIREMKGEYFSWLSHDDIYYPDKVKKEVEAILASGDVTTLVQAEYEFYHMGSKTYTPTDFHKYYDVKEITNSIFSVMQLQFHACSALIHKSHFERVGIFDESLRTLQDIDMWFRIFRGQKSLFLPEILHIVREHEEAGSNTISCYEEEQGKTYLKMVKALDYHEMEEVFGNAPAFLCRIAGYLKSYKRTLEYEEMKKYLLDVPKNRIEEEETSIAQFREYLKKISGGKEKEIAIFGAGHYGLRIKYELESRGIEPKYFIDNNPSKWGQIIDGILCVSMEEARKEKENLLIVLAQRNFTLGLKQVEEAGFSHYITKQSLDAKILHTLPAMSRIKEWIG